MLYDKNGIEIDIKQFEKDSLIVARVTRRMDQTEFLNFVKDNQETADMFSEYGMALLFCPDWVEFKEFKNLGGEHALSAAKEQQ